jgi:hypothetical protein
MNIRGPEYETAQYLNSGAGCIHFKAGLRPPFFNDFKQSETSFRSF